MLEISDFIARYDSAEAIIKANMTEEDFRVWWGKHEFLDKIDLLPIMEAKVVEIMNVKLATFLTLNEKIFITGE